MVTIWTELARVARVNGETVAFRVWTLLRHLDTDGSGITELDDARRALRTKFGWTPTHAANVLRRHEGQWWTAHEQASGRQVLRYVGLERACLRLHAIPGTPITISEEKLVSGHQLFCAAVYGAWVAAGRTGARTISRQRLEGLWGVTSATLRAWEHENVKVRPNWALLPRLESPQHEALAGYPDRSDPAVRVLRDADGEHIYRQLPNTYASDAGSPRRQNGRVRAISARCKSVIEQTAWTHTDAGQVVRLYFADGSGVENVRRARRHVCKAGQRETAYAWIASKMPHRPMRGALWLAC